MKKIPALILIDREAHRPTDQLNPKAIWLLEHPEAVATRKRDGQATKFLGGAVNDLNNWVTRRAVNPGKPAPQGFILEETDATTGKSFGWEPVTQSGVLKAFKEALAHLSFTPDAGETLELCGPKLQKNPEGLTHHQLFRHGTEVVPLPPLAELAAEGSLVEALRPLAREWQAAGMEGVVFWLNGAPVVKLRVKDLLPEADAR